MFSLNEKGVSKDSKPSEGGSSVKRVTFIIPVTDDSVLEKNIKRSKIFQEGHHQFIFKYGYRNIAKAYNEALLDAESELLVFCHQDVFLPDRFEEELFESLLTIEKLDPRWGVLGPAGVILKENKRFFSPRVQFAGNFSTNVLGGRLVLDYFGADPLPRALDTLDEFLFVVKKKDASFDENIPFYHFYCVDLCLRCLQNGLKNYAISTYVHHNSKATWVHQDFIDSAQYMFRKHRCYLPFASTCTIISEDKGTMKLYTDFLAFILLGVHSVLRFSKRKKIWQQSR